jgi:membrane associated rhomboid family serine protease
MRWLDRLEQKLGFLAFPGLIRIVVAFQALVFILELVSPGFSNILVFNRDAVLAGQFWRVFTFVFIPPAMGWLGPLGILIALYFLWFLGEGLEEAWGAFKLNVFFFVGLAAAGFHSLRLCNHLS